MNETLLLHGLAPIVSRRTRLVILGSFPSVASLEAAIRPEASEWLYYLHDAEQNLHPARNEREHERNRRLFDVW